MMKYLLLLLVFLSNTSFAQTSPCSATPPVYHLEILDSPLTYDFTLNATQLRQISTKEHVEGSKPLGMFEPSYLLAARYNVRTLKNSISSCSYISDIYISLTFYSKIYLSQESQRYACTYNRVLTHEQTHYNIQRKAMIDLSYQLRSMAQQYFNNLPINYNNQINLGEIAEQQKSLLNNDINQFISNHTEPFHGQLDTPENYKRESMLCGFNEAKAISNLLFN